MSSLQAIFIGSYHLYTLCPTTEMAEFAFIGRSNVGKSSLINSFTGNKKLAKTSSTPGKTQCINLFEVNKSWVLTDLPGYGFAKVSKTNREKWQKMTRDYLLLRPNLAMVFVLIDSRISAQKSDLEFINWLGENGISFAIAFTKADKQSKLGIQKLVDELWKTLQTTWEVFPEYIVTSSISGQGNEDLQKTIEIACANYNAQE